MNESGGKRERMWREREERKKESLGPGPLNLGT